MKCPIWVALVAGAVVAAATWWFRIRNEPTPQPRLMGRKEHAEPSPVARSASPKYLSDEEEWWAEMLERTTIKLDQSLPESFGSRKKWRSRVKIMKVSPPSEVESSDSEYAAPQ